MSSLGLSLLRALLEYGLQQAAVDPLCDQFQLCIGRLGLLRGHVGLLQVSHQGVEAGPERILRECHFAAEPPVMAAP